MTIFTSCERYNLRLKRSRNVGSPCSHRNRSLTLSDMEILSEVFSTEELTILGVRGWRGKKSRQARWRPRKAPCCHSTSSIPLPTIIPSYPSIVYIHHHPSSINHISGPASPHIALTTTNTPNRQSDPPIPDQERLKLT